jgi:hypothetical protein
MTLLRIAIEEASTGLSLLEREFVFYAKVTDLAFLKKAAEDELQEQWEIKIPQTEENAAQGRVRIRKTFLADGKIDYVMTTKVKVEGGEDEVAIKSSEDNFEQFRKLSGRGMIKHRFVFPIEGTELKWEVDMYFKPGVVPENNHDFSNFAEWCKVDLEVNATLKEMPPFPFVSEHVIDNNTGNASAEDKAMIDKLYSELFITKNLYKSKT